MAQTNMSSKEKKGEEPTTRHNTQHITHEQPHGTAHARRTRTRAPPPPRSWTSITHARLCILHTHQRTPSHAGTRAREARRVRRVTNEAWREARGARRERREAGGE